MLIYRLLRSGSKCQGGEAGADDCNKAIRVKCNRCESIRDSPRIQKTVCDCGNKHGKRLRCDDCPVLQVDRIRSITPAGRLLERVLDLDFETQKFSVDWATVRASEERGLKILLQERQKWEAEDREAKQQEAEMKQAMEKAMQKSQQEGGF